VGAPAALVGRRAELGRLAPALAGALAGRGCAAWVEGEPGIGKSALLDAVAAMAEDRGFRVLRAAATQMGRGFALQVLSECVRGLPWSAPVLGTQVPADPVAAAGEQIMDMVDQLVTRTPVVLVLDDAQWADAASLRVWAALVERCRTVPLLLCLACRPVPDHPELAELAAAHRSRGDPLLEPAPLTGGEVVELLRRSLPAEPTAAQRRLADHTGGNPLYVLELAQDLARHPERYEEEAGSPSLRGLIAEHLQYLSGATRMVLSMAALLGPVFSRADLAVVAAAAAPDLASAVQEATATRVLVATDAEQLAFRHGLIHQQVVDSLPRGLQAALRLEAAQALHSAGAPPRQVASLLLAAQDDDAVAGWLRGWLPGAAPLLLYVAPEVTGELLARALRDAPADLPHRQELRAWQVIALALRGRDEEMEKLAGPLLAEPGSGPLAGQVTWILANALIRNGRVPQARAVLDAALADGRADPAWAARLRSLHALTTVLTGPAGAEQDVRAAVAHAERSGDGFALAYALHVLAYAQLGADRISEALAVLDRALAVVGDDSSALDLRLLLIANRVVGLMHLGLIDQAIDQVRAGLRLAEELGATSRADPLRNTAGALFLLTGQWDDALAELAGMDPDRQATQRTARAAGIRALVAVHRGQLAAAEAALAALPEQPADIAAYYGDHPHLAVADLAEARGDAAGAWPAILARCGDHWPDIVIGSYLPWFIRHALAAGDRPAAERIAASAAQESSESAAQRACALYGRALLRRDPAAAEEGGQLLRGMGARFLVAVFLEEAALLRAEQGDATAARGHLVQALEIYQDLDADWDIRRASARLRAHGVRTRQHAVRVRPATGWAALTPTEEKVATLAGQGSANGEIAATLLLSRRTVETHISRALAKLGGSSRVDIAREAARQHSATAGPMPDRGRRPAHPPRRA
jgi:DNA-binding CsgD family transcriptional regulator